MDRCSPAQLNAYLEQHSYLGSAIQVTKLDHDSYLGMQTAERIPDATVHPHLHRWFLHISALMRMHGAEKDAMGRRVPKGDMPLQLAADKDAKGRRVPKGDMPQQLAADCSTSSCSSGLSHLCVLDFEKTCEKDVQLTPQEIIEFPSVLFKIAGDGTAHAVGEFESFVKPQVHTVLTPFCTELTGITQAQVDGAEPLATVLDRHHNWLREQVPEEEKCIFVTCGDMDLKRSLPEDPNVPATLPACYRKWLNIKKEFGVVYRHLYKKKGSQPRSMADMLSILELPLEGKHHSGIDDCRNIGKVAQKMLRDGWAPLSK